MKKLSIILFAVLMAVPFFSFGQSETKINLEPEKKISYTFINEYGFYGGNSIGFTGVFVNGIRFNKTQDVLGIGIGYEIDTRPNQSYFSPYSYIQGAQSIPIFVNYRHYFPGKRALKPLINIGLGVRVNFWKEYYNYWIDDPCYWNDDPSICDVIYPNYPKISQEAGLGFYGTIAAGFKVKAFSFTSGFFLKSWGNCQKIDVFGGVEVKVGFSF